MMDCFITSWSRKNMLKDKLSKDDEIKGSVLMNEVVNKRIYDWFKHSFEGHTTVFQHKLYRVHPAVRKMLSLEAFCIILNYWRFVKLDKDQILYKQKQWWSWFYFLIMGVISLTIKGQIYRISQLGEFI